jgi:hypothetical protein
MFSRRDRPDRPGSSPFTPYTALLALLWLLLVVYIITHPDPIGVIILIVMGVFFVAPLLFIWMVTFSGKRRRDRGIGGEYETPAAQNGRYAAGMNGAHGANGATGPHDGQQAPDDRLGEISQEKPEEGGENQ